ncbi:uncharacterized protein LOC125493986 [Beta vulgaris subsp. vulgaris]|uniref:uncharacterized protein LOC125493986 n=1 Tax=Beta vulgaris subsp. vulgaris TaxID=3555 RepID=UPI002037161E|nr:uncharacterized protein LOC125493986 [Beta vulgaris subsp. vulgaris]
MAVMSHRHTAGFRKLRAGLKEKTELAEEQAKEIEEPNKGFKAERALWATKKAAFEQRIKDLTSQRNCVLCQRDEIIEEWKTSKAGLEFAVDMGLEASEVAAREAVDRLQTAFWKVYPQASWSPVEAKYNISAEATFREGGEADPTLEVDDAIDMDEFMGGEPHQVENPLAPGGPIADDEVVPESSSDRVASSDSSSDSGDDEVVSETSESDSSSSSA